MILETNRICHKNPKWLSCVDEIFVPRTYTLLSGKRLKVFSPKSETWIVYPLLTLLFNPISEVLARKIEEENEIRIIQIVKGDANSSLFTGYIIIYIENPWESIRKLPQIEKINECSNFAAKKMTTQNSVVILYTSSEQSTEESVFHLQFYF